MKLELLRARRSVRYEKGNDYLIMIGSCNREVTAATDAIAKEQWALRNKEDLSEFKGQVMRFVDMSSSYATGVLKANADKAVVTSVSGRPLLTLSRCAAYQKLVANLNDDAAPSGAGVPAPPHSFPAHHPPARPAVMPPDRETVPLPGHASSQHASRAESAVPSSNHVPIPDRRAVSVAPSTQTRPPLPPPLPPLPPPLPPLPLSTNPASVPHVADQRADHRIRHSEDDGEGPPAKRPRIGDSSEPQFDAHDGLVSYEWQYPDGNGACRVPGLPPHRGERRRTDEFWRYVDPATGEMVGIPPGYTVNGVHVWGGGSLSNDPDIEDGQVYNPAIEDRYVHGHD
ncbi:hypothetical protein DFH11DRAFT_1776208 [Phellopilus nigrolimitatus]|nr:hypothetical protein DFH11DRAFT_1776208 [Phellopilus nigrolimitatus]